MTAKQKEDKSEDVRDLLEDMKKLNKEIEIETDKLKNKRS